jgi:hypothetical protein
MTTSMPGLLLLYFSMSSSLNVCFFYLSAIHAIKQRQVHGLCVQPAHVIEYNLRHVSGASTSGHRWRHGTFDTVALDGEQHCAQVLLGFFLSVLDARRRPVVEGCTKHAPAVSLEWSVRGTMMFTSCICSHQTASGAMKMSVASLELYDISCARTRRYVCGVTMLTPCTCSYESLLAVLRRRL